MKRSTVIDCPNCGRHDWSFQQNAVWAYAEWSAEKSEFVLSSFQEDYDGQTIYRCDGYEGCGFETTDSPERY